MRKLKNRMEESLELFETIVNNQWFVNTPMMLFFNKRDLFEAKIIVKPLSLCFTDYNGENTYEAAKLYIAQKFEALKNSPKTIYTHFTCATSTENISQVFNIVTDIILDRNLKSRGLF